MLSDRITLPPVSTSTATVSVFLRTYCRIDGALIMSRRYTCGSYTSCGPKTIERDGSELRQGPAPISAACFANKQSFKSCGSNTLPVRTRGIRRATRADFPLLLFSCQSVERRIERDSSSPNDRWSSVVF